MEICVNVISLHIIVCVSSSGPERKSAVIEKKNQERVAYHEGGHAIIALFTEGTASP